MATATSAAPSAASSLEGMPDDGHDAAALGERAHLRAAVGREDLGADVIDVERARDGLARLARFAGEEHRLDARVEEALDGGARPARGDVLKGDHPDELAGERDEENAPALRLELGARASATATLTCSWMRSARLPRRACRPTTRAP